MRVRGLYNVTLMTYLHDTAVFIRLVKLSFDHWLSKGSDLASCMYSVVTLTERADHWLK